MYDDTVLVVTCEVAERLLAIRSLLDDPAHHAKGPGAAVAFVLHTALDGVAADLSTAIIPALRAGPLPNEAAAGELMARLSRLSATLRSVHQRLGYLGRRWAHSAPDIVARKLREDGAPLTPPAVCLSDEYDCLDHDIATRLRQEIAALDVQLPPPSPREDIILLPRCEAGNPLAWTLLLRPLSRIIARQRAILGRDAPMHRGDGEAPTCEVYPGSPRRAC